MQQVQSGKVRGSEVFLWCLIAFAALLIPGAAWVVLGALGGLLLAETAVQLTRLVLRWGHRARIRRNYRGEHRR